MCQGGVKSLKEVELSVPTLKCESCGGKLKSALEDVRGVRDVRVEVPEKRVVVSFNSCAVNEQQLREVADKAGFPAVAT
jgi:copper chaperone CopZ